MTHPSTGLDYFSREFEAAPQLAEAKLRWWEKTTARVSAVLILFTVIWAALFTLWATKDTFGSWVDYLNIFSVAAVGPAGITTAFNLWDRLRSSPDS